MNRSFVQLTVTAIGQTAFDKLARLAALRRGGESQINQFQEIEDTELNGVEEGEDRMSEEAGDEGEGEGESAPPDWPVRAGPRNRPSQNESEAHEATHVPLRDRCTHIA